MLNRNIETFIGCESEYDEASIVIFGAPFDSTTSFRPGTRFASRVMRSESFGMETYSPYQDKDLEDYNIFDGGDLELAFGNSRRALDDIAGFTRTVVADNKIPLMIGGEHLVTLGAVEAVFEKYPDLHIIHFDAHADLRADYLGEKLSHASVIRRCYELVGDGKIYQFGIRSGDREEFNYAREGHTIMHKFDFEGLSDVVSSLQGKNIYFTIDLDVLDTSVFPGTGTQEAGGVSFNELINAIIEVSKLNIVGCDINELSPSLDTSGASTAVALKVLRELLLSICR